MSAWMPLHLAESVDRLDLNLVTDAKVPEIPDLLNRTVLSGGKKLRPALCFLVGEIFDLSATQIGPYARVVEWLHCATLAHDDVVDVALVRRKRATLNAVSSNARAVLAGDLLLARVIVEACNLGNIDVIRELSMALEGLVNGEWLQRDARGTVPASLSVLEEISQKKTGSLMSWCCVVPARLSSASAETIADCRRFGDLLGIAFQMTDDVLDFSVSGEKTYAQDLLDGQCNFVTLELISLFPQLRPAIEAVLNGTTPKSNDWPWTETQLEAAKRATGALVSERLGEASEILRKVGERVGSRPSAVATLQGALEFIGRRRS